MCVMLIQVSGLDINFYQEFIDLLFYVHISDQWPVKHSLSIT